MAMLMDDYVLMIMLLLLIMMTHLIHTNICAPPSACKVSMTKIIIILTTIRSAYPISCRVISRVQT